MTKHYIKKGILPLSKIHSFKEKVSAVEVSFSFFETFA
jgi:hypothetical protein